VKQMANNPTVVSK